MRGARRAITITRRARRFPPSARGWHAAIPEHRDLGATVPLGAIAAIVTLAGPAGLPLGGRPRAPCPSRTLERREAGSSREALDARPHQATSTTRDTRLMQRTSE